MTVPFLGPVPWARSLGPFLGPVPWARSLGPFLGPVPWARSLGPLLGDRDPDRERDDHDHHHEQHEFDAALVEERLFDPQHRLPLCLRRSVPGRRRAPREELLPLLLRPV